MKKDTTLRILFVSGIIFIAIFFLVMVIKIYNYTLNDAKKTHQLQQMEMARAAVSGISIYLSRLSDDMHFLANYPGVNALNKPLIKNITDPLFSHYDDKIIESIFILDNSGRTFYCSGALPPSTLINEFRFNPVFGNKQPEYSHIEPYTGNDVKSGLVFAIILPFQKPDNPKACGGYVGFMVSFDSLVHKYIVPLKLGEKDFAWIMDGSGRLIYHPTHKDMLLRGITQASPSCMKCHSSFDIQKKMISGNASFDEYTIANEPPKIMAYFPLNLQGDRWILAISTLLPEVTADLRDKFSLFFGLGIVILVVIVSLGSLLYFQTVRKIRAEEANRHLEQRQNFQEQLNHAAKLASIGELVDSVAHEINTPLSIISSHIDALNLQNDFPQKYTEDLGTIRNQAKRINNYTKSILNYSQRIPFNPVPQMITPIIDECLFLLNPHFNSKRIRIIRKYKDDLPLVEVDKGQIEQVFINLFNNSVDAITSKGEIRIETSTVERNISSVNKEEIIYAVIAVSDNGCGIKQENLNNIFETFFTTKTGGKGTGLGLSISKAIILRHKGKIEVTSEPDKLTTFKIYLPINTKA